MCVRVCVRVYASAGMQAVAPVAAVVVPLCVCVGKRMRDRKRARERVGETECVCT